MLSFALANDETSDLSSIFVSPLDVSETSVTEGVEAARDGVDEGCGVVGARVDSVFFIGDKVEGRIGPSVAAAAIGEIVGVFVKNADVGVSATREGDNDVVGVAVVLVGGLFVGSLETTTTFCTMYAPDVTPLHWYSFTVGSGRQTDSSLVALNPISSSSAANVYRNVHATSTLLPLV